MKMHTKKLAEVFADPKMFLKNLDNINPKSEKFSLLERTLPGALSVYKQIYDEINKPSKPPWTGF